MSTLLILHGLPRSGKSSYANKLIGYKIISLDKYRLSLTGDTYLEDDEPFVWMSAFNDAANWIKFGNICIDECNPTLNCINYWMRLKEIYPDINVKIVKIDTPDHICLLRAIDQGLRDVINRKSYYMISQYKLDSYCKSNNIELEIV